MSTRGEAEVSGPTNVGGHAATHSFLNISDARLEEIFERFKEVSGEMKVRHLDDAMRVARMNPQDFEVRRILEDLGNPDSFSLTSFKHTMKDALAEWSSRDQVQELLQCFRVFDRQGTGVLSRQSIHKIMGMGNPSFSEGQLEDMLQKVHGTSPSGAVQYLDLALFLLGPEEEVQEEVQEVEEVPEQKDKGHSEEKKDLPTSSGGWVATWRTSLDAPDPAGPRADEYEVTLDQTNGSRMGIDWLAGGKMLIVQGIDSGGLVEEWNEMMPELEVKENHLIVEANGVRGSAQMIEECMKDQELHLRVLRVDDDDPWSNKDYVLAQVARNVSFLEQASVELRDDPDVILAAVLRDPFDALRFASERLRTEAGYVEELVRRSKAAWLVQLPGLEHFRADLDFVERCEKVAGTGLVFTYYESSTCFLSMRKAFKATGASVPGGIAYDAVMAKLEEEGEGGSATVWFGDEPVFGVNADDGKWRHPPDDCGRDQKEVPAEAERTGMWNCKVEGRKGDVMPIAGRKYNCWCCHWLRKVREAHEKGAVICCAISNIYNADWVQRHGAGSSELSDEQAAKFKQTIPEVFKNGKPDGWGKGRIHVSSGHDYAREAPIHPRTELPLGEGCRWERWALDGQNFAVFAFFMP